MDNKNVRLKKAHVERATRGGSFFTINTLFLCVTSITEGRSLHASA